MLAIAGFLGLVGAVGVHHWNLRRGVYHRVPVELLALLGLSTLAGYMSLERGGVVAWALFAVEALASLSAVIYLVFVAHFPRPALSVSVGDRLPEFELPDSEGGTHASTSLIGKSAALYLFYRGDW